jgi:glutathione S-transferase
MTATLYVVPGSHPCAAVAAALDLKGIPYKRVDLPPGLHALHQRLRFGRRTVPSLTLDGRTLSGSREIMRALDAERPEPPLLPADPALQRRVLDAEAWGDEVLQAATRRILWAALPNAATDSPSFLEGSKVPLPAFLARPAMPGLAMVERRLNGVGEERVRGDLRALPGWLDHADQLIADGTIGTDPANAADLQITASVRLLATLEDLRPVLAGRPVEALARRRFPAFPGHVRQGAIPSVWLQ